MSDKNNSKEPRNRPGAPTQLTEPRQTSFMLEAEDKARLAALGGSSSEHMRRAIKEYLQRQEA